MHSKMAASLALLSFTLLLAVVEAQSPGNGVSKSTYSCNDPVAAKVFLYKYFPVGTPGDECDDDICVCPAVGSTPQWLIQQGRVYALETLTPSPPMPGSPGAGFGLHCVNVSNHVTTGGLSTAQVEAHFSSKLGDMSNFDSFMDFNVMFYTTGLEAYVTTFKADGIPMFSTTWSYNGTTWTSVFIQVPNTQMIIELCQDTTLTALEATHHATPRATARALEKVSAMVHPLSDTLATTSAAIITPLAVNRAVSAKAMAALENFYVTGMGTKKLEDTVTADYTRKCFLWSGSSVDICFYNRDDEATKGNFKVGDMEDMLNTVHRNVLGKSPVCGNDKWFDNHYAIDSMTADTSSIVPYIEQNKILHHCASSSSLAAIYDPTGWGIQLDMQFSSAPSDCSSSEDVAELTEGMWNSIQKPVSRGSRKLQNTYNPACTLSATCA